MAHGSGNEHLLKLRRAVRHAATAPTCMNTLFATDTITTDLAPSHAEVEQCARELWTNSGRPNGRDDEIWLEAERRLISAQRAPLAHSEFPHRLARQDT